MAPANSIMRFSEQTMTSWIEAACMGMGASLILTGVLKLWGVQTGAETPDPVFLFASAREIQVLAAGIELTLGGLILTRQLSSRQRYLGVAGFVALLWGYRFQGVEIAQCSCLGGVAGAGATEKAIALGLLIAYSLVTVAMAWSLFRQSQPITLTHESTRQIA